MGDQHSAAAPNAKAAPVLAGLTAQERTALRRIAERLLGGP